MTDYLSIVQQCDDYYLKNLEQTVTSSIEQGEIPETCTFPIALQFELMAECNLKCLHCYNRSGDVDLATKMKLDDWLSLSHHIVANGGIFQCILSGGEPLLFGKKRLPQIMDILHSDGTGFVIITNGYLLDQEWIDIIKDYRYYWVQVSIDGATAAIHDSFRGVEGSWHRAVKGAYLTSKAGFPLVIAHTVTPRNLHQVDEMAELSYALGATSAIIGESLPSGRVEEFPEILLDSEQRNQLYGKIDELHKHYFKRMEIQRSSGVFHQLNRYRVTPNLGGIIRPNGDVRMDCMAPFVIGNVLDSPFAEIWKTKGADCWKNPSVLNYINSIDPISNRSHYHYNHVSQDIII